MRAAMRSKRGMLVGLYRAFNARDIDAAVALLHPDVNWPNGMDGGRVRGRDAVRAYWMRQWGMIDPRVEPVRMADDDMGRLVVDVHQVVRDRGGKLLKDQVVQHVYVVGGGLVERMDVRSDAPMLPHRD